ncbi:MULTISPECIES: hypothetical protein [Bacillales]|uniref:hypothetical protein n=1 Tax=Bacillales TaxID=1385 RepID=UPI0003483D0F|nr:MULTISPECIES: hypothetical protein [Bacillales]KMZ42532.1 hypothetical protein AC624_16155 [Bacillus sp. FJAT-27238]
MQNITKEISLSKEEIRMLLETLEIDGESGYTQNDFNIWMSAVTKLQEAFVHFEDDHNKES